MDSFTDEQKADVFGSMSVATCAKEDILVAGDSSPVFEALDHTSSEFSSEESYKGCKSHTEPAIILAVASAETGTTSEAGRTLQWE